ncbi:MAG: PIG-L family deacetylase, partial [Veillonella sp.]|nr:PIG-L family deacetylase [Veillonella sp.]
MSTSTFKYREFFNGDTVMVIVPHEDDEINVAGATIYGAIKEGLHVSLVYVTNGDFQYKADIRYKEVTRMASIMNLPMENIHFLGFPDNSGKELLANRDTIFTNHAGFNETHGAYGIKDYPTQ